MNPWITRRGSFRGAQTGGHGAEGSEEVFEVGGRASVLDEEDGDEPAGGVEGGIRAKGAAVADETVVHVESESIRLRQVAGLPGDRLADGCSERNPQTTR